MPGQRIRIPLVALLAGLLIAPTVTACTSDGDDSDGGPELTVTQLDRALWRADELGEAWTDRVTDDGTPAPPVLTDWCDGVQQRDVPGDAKVSQVRLLAKGTTGTDWLDQTALVYPDAEAAEAALAQMREQATACPASTAVPRQTLGPDSSIDAHTRTVAVSDVTVRDWHGFVSAIASEYTQADAARGDNRVFALNRGNAVLVILLGTLRAGSETRMNWTSVTGSLVEPILARADGEDPAPPSPTATG
ncbi:hypothetical protein O7627_21615 [Solwaraspora sp. WMMD1047]|uniref:hypothetical protein n=1 Tax=Solwaraspora sp. WMMD1047 TaxID=3016102 RepID=UPI002417C117|nr:hypothetical protein [Solwaraspora sp. WMMD1047]MDG4831883.1 hypothetical protein [Solwaraspora sp. WMMD1047]